MLKVGYIGLGLMGKSIARNILKAGFPLVVHNRSRPAVDELVAEGAKAASSPAEVASQVDVVFTNLPDSPDVEKVALGASGIIEGAHEGLVFIDNSTIKPATARHIAAELAEKGVFALDAPVSGGDIGARNGTLAIMVGGDASALEKVMPVLLAMGKTVTHVGDAGAGQIAKAANQIMVAAQMVAMGELLVFAQKAGADPQKVVAAIKGGAAQCWSLDVKPPRLFCGQPHSGIQSPHAGQGFEYHPRNRARIRRPAAGDRGERAVVQCHAADGHGRAGQLGGHWRDRGAGGSQAGGE